MLPWVVPWVPDKQPAAEPHSCTCSRLATRLVAPATSQGTAPSGDPELGGLWDGAPQPLFCLVF